MTEVRLRREIRDGVFERRSTPAAARGVLLYVHGLGESGLCFEPLLEHPELAGWEQIAPDLPGYGKSDWPRAPLTLAEQAEFLWRRYPPRSGRPAVLLGHSMGGVVGQYLCESRPAEFQGFVNVEGNLSEADCTFSSRAAVLDADEFVAEGFGRLAEQVYHDGVEDPPQRGYYASLRFCDPRAFHANSRELVEASRTGDLARRFSRLPGDKLYVAGTRDRDANAAPLELLASAGVLEAWADCGHWPFLDQPERFAGRLAQFLTGKWHGHPCP